MIEFPRHTTAARVQASRWALTRMLDRPELAQCARLALEAARGVGDPDSLLALLEGFMRAPERATPRQMAALALEALDGMPSRPEQLRAGGNLLGALSRLSGSQRLARAAIWCQSLRFPSHQLRAIRAVLAEPDCQGASYRRWAYQLLSSLDAPTRSHLVTAAALAEQLLLELHPEEAELGQALLECFGDARSRLAAGRAYLEHGSLVCLERVVRVLDAAIFGDYLPLGGLRLLRLLGLRQPAPAASAGELRQQVWSLGRLPVSA